VALSKPSQPPHPGRSIAGGELRSPRRRSRSVPPDPNRMAVRPAQRPDQTSSDSGSSPVERRTLIAWAIGGGPRTVIAAAGELVITPGRSLMPSGPAIIVFATNHRLTPPRTSGRTPSGRYRSVRLPKRNDAEAIPPAAHRVAFTNRTQNSAGNQAGDLNHREPPVRSATVSPMRCARLPHWAFVQAGTHEKPHDGTRYGSHKRRRQARG